jgi:uncharacterized protein YjbJ (UPF0337 family)
MPLACYGLRKIAQLPFITLRIAQLDTRIILLTIFRSRSIPRQSKVLGVNRNNGPKYAWSGVELRLAQIPERILTLTDAMKLGGSMTPSTKDQAKGTFHEVKGRAKEAVGQVTNNPTLEAKGKGEKLAGKIQKKAGQIERVF